MDVPILVGAGPLVRTVVEAVRPVVPPTVCMLVDGDAVISDEPLRTELLEERGDDCGRLVGAV